MPDVEKLSLASADPLEDRVEQLKELFPEAFSEGKVDFEKLRLELGDDVDQETAAEFDTKKGFETGRVFISMSMRDMRDVQSLIRFLEDTLQIDMHGVELKDAIKTSKNYEFWAYTFRKPNQDDPDRPYTNLKAYQPVS